MSNKCTFGQLFNFISTIENTGETTYDLWRSLEGNENGTVEEFLSYLKNDSEYIDIKLKDYATIVELNSAIKKSAEEINLSVSEVQKSVDDLDSALDDTNDKFNNYPTISEMNSAIDLSAQEINLSVSKLETDISNLESSIKDTEGNLKDYPTITEMNSAIELSAQNINLKVSEVEKSVTDLDSALDITNDKFKDYPTITEMNSAISSSAEEINLAVSEMQKSVTDLDSALDNTNNKFSEYPTTTEMNSAIALSAEEINLSVSEIRNSVTNLDSALDSTNEKFKDYSTTTEMNSAITASAESINLNVSAIQKDVNNLDTNIKDVEASLELKVDSKNLISEINASADKISLKGNRFIVESTNLTITEDGTIKAKNGEFTGKITGSSGEFTDGFSVRIPDDFGYTFSMMVGEDGESGGSYFKIEYESDDPAGQAYFRLEPGYFQFTSRFMDILGERGLNLQSTWQIVLDAPEVIVQDSLYQEKSYDLITELAKLQTNRVLWSGGNYMSAAHTVTLSEPISSQLNGIVLVFSEYNSEVLNQSFHHIFIPKHHVSVHNGAAECIQMSTGNLSVFATKYLYIHDDKIVGHDNNIATGTGTSGIKYTNNRFVLRYVIGV